MLGAREAMGDLLGCDPDGVVFGRSMTQLTFDLARALAKAWAARRRGRGDPARPRREHPALDTGRRARRCDGALGRLRPRHRGARPSTRPCCRSGPAWSRSPAPPTCSAPVPTSPAIAARRARRRRHAVRRRRPPDRRTRRSTSRAWAPTSTPARRTSSSARTSACSRPTRRCSSRCTPTSCCPRPTPCRSASSSARCPTSCSPASPRPSTSSRTSCPARRSAASRVLESMQRVEDYEDVLFERLLSGLDAIDGRAALRPPRPSDADGAVLGRGTHRPEVHDAARRPRGERPGRQLLRPRGLPAGSGSATAARCAPASRRTPPEDDVDRLLAGVAALAG